MAGYAADPPGTCFYFQSLDSTGEPSFDEHGLPLLDCSRGTNDVEAAHRQIVTTFGTWNVGIEMSDYLLAEWRHRFNHLVSERRRTGFPKFGHYDTWLIDKHQLLVEQNHNVDFYPSWPNTADYADTSECFGTVPIHSSELDEALQGISLSCKVKASFTPDQKYLCKRMGTPAPLLPVYGEEECKLFDKMVRSECSDLDMEKMAIKWCNYVDGENIFPKLPVYLRNHHSKWVRNQRVREAMEKAEKGDIVLRRINEETLHQLVPASPGSPDQPELPLDTFAAVSAQATVVASLFHLEPYFTLNSREI